MKLGVVIAVSKYTGSGLSDLPGCVQDANLIRTILAAQSEYEEILTLTTNTQSANVKQHLISFVNKYKGKSISEFVFYYTGHGAFQKNEYYYLFSDYRPATLHQTALENTELDNLIRSLNPSLTTKIVDSCQSGVPYIKDSGEIDLYLKGTQSGFHNCYFLFSSHMDELSYQDNVLSAFTRSIGELIVSRTGPIRHKDIIDYVSDSFALNALQTPFFVVQADFTDQFCTVDSALQKKVAGFFPSAAEPSMASLAGGNTLKALVEADAVDYCTRDEAFAALTRLSDYLVAYKHPTDVLDLYKAEASQLLNYDAIPNLAAIGKWLKETKHTFFAEAIERSGRPKRLSREYGISYRFTPVSPAESRFVHFIEAKVIGVRSTTEMPYAGLLLRATALYPNLDSAACFLVPFISRTHMQLFAGVVSYQARGWEEETIVGGVKWRTFEERMKDDVGMAKTISVIVNEFWDLTMARVKKKYGLVKEESESDTGKMTLLLP